MASDNKGNAVAGLAMDVEEYTVDGLPLLDGASQGSSNDIPLIAEFSEGEIKEEPTDDIGESELMAEEYETDLHSAVQGNSDDLPLEVEFLEVEIKEEPTDDIGESELMAEEYETDLRSAVQGNSDDLPLEVEFSEVEIKEEPTDDIGESELMSEEVETDLHCASQNNSNDLPLVADFSEVDFKEEPPDDKDKSELMSEEDETDLSLPYIGSEISYNQYDNQDNVAGTDPANQVIIIQPSVPVSSNTTLCHENEVGATLSQAMLTNPDLVKPGFHTGKVSLRPEPKSTECKKLSQLKVRQLKKSVPKLQNLSFNLFAKSVLQKDHPYCANAHSDRKTKKGNVRKNVVLPSVCFKNMTTTCVLCDRKYNYPADVEIHQWTDHIIKCLICDLPFDNWDLFLLHESLHLAGKPYEILEGKHKNTHSGILLCTLCSTYYPNKSTFQIHNLHHEQCLTTTEVVEVPYEPFFEEALKSGLEFVYRPWPPAKRKVRRKLKKRKILSSNKHAEYGGYNVNDVLDARVTAEGAMSSNIRHSSLVAAHTYTQQHNSTSVQFSSGTAAKSSGIQQQHRSVHTSKKRKKKSHPCLVKMNGEFYLFVDKCANGVPNIVTLDFEEVDDEMPVEVDFGASVKAHEKRINEFSRLIQINKERAKEVMVSEIEQSTSETEQQDNVPNEFQSEVEKIKNIYIPGSQSIHNVEEQSSPVQDSEDSEYIVALDEYIDTEDSIMIQTTDLECELCTRKFPTLTELDQHYMAAHQRPLFCTMCKEVYFSIETLDMHTVTCALQHSKSVLIVPPAPINSEKATCTSVQVLEILGTKRSNPESKEGQRKVRNQSSKYKKVEQMQMPLLQEEVGPDRLNQEIPGCETDFETSLRVHERSLRVLTESIESSKETVRRLIAEKESFIVSSKSEPQASPPIKLEDTEDVPQHDPDLLPLFNKDGKLYGYKSLKPPADANVKSLCPFCNQLCYKQIFLSHIDVHLKSIQGSNSISCNKCGRLYKSAKDILYRQIDNETFLGCVQCDA